MNKEDFYKTRVLSEKEWNDLLAKIEKENASKMNCRCGKNCTNQRYFLLTG